MHIFGKKYKKQKKWAVLKIRNYYGQYKWFLFYITQFIDVDLKFLEYFKRGVVKWVGYDSFFQKWFFMLNTLISYRWRQIQLILNDKLKRDQYLWKQSFFTCLDRVSTLYPSLNTEYKKIQSHRYFIG